MKVITVADDGTIAIEFTAEEARAIRDDLDQTAWNKVSETGDQLHSHLEAICGPQTRVATGREIAQRLSDFRRDASAHRGATS